MLSFVATIDAKYFRGELAPEVIAILEDASTSPGSRRILLRMVRRMALARFRGADLTELTARWMMVIAKHLVDSVALGIVPGVTFAGRHRALDELLASGSYGPIRRLVDVGSGYPPVTAVETARRFGGAEIVACDPGWPAFVLQEADGCEAFFDSHGELMFVQSATRLPSAPDPLTRDRLVATFQRLKTGAPGPADAGGTRLVPDPIRRYHTENLRVVFGGIGDDLAATEVDVVRCFNVLNYFPPCRRRHAIGWAAALLRPGGILLTGTNHAGSAELRYVVSRVSDGGVAEQTFAFTIDNVRPLGIIPWADLVWDPEVARLVRCVGALRADDAFRTDFDGRLDELMAERGVCRRDAAGHLRFLAFDLRPEELGERMGQIAARLDGEGFVARAALVLTRAGLTARRNSVGHVEIEIGDSTRF